MTDQELKDLVASLAINAARRDAEQVKREAERAKREAERAKREAERDAQREVLRAQTDAQMAQTDAKLAATSAKIDRIAEMVGGISNNQGSVAEEFFSNSLAAKPQIGGMTFDSVTPNLMFKSKREHGEFDIVLTNGKSVALIEVKYKAHVGDLDKAQAKIQSYRRWRPEHKDYSIFAGLASFSVPPDVIELAHERGIFVLQRKGDLLEIDATQMRAQ